jgi:hypothetical protein
MAISSERGMMDFPVKTNTRAGSVVTLTGYYNGYDRPWVGFIEVDLVDAKFMQPMSWLKDGHYISTEIERSLDIALPE